MSELLMYASAGMSAGCSVAFIFIARHPYDYLFLIASVLFAAAAGWLHFKISDKLLP